VYRDWRESDWEMGSDRERGIRLLRERRPIDRDGEVVHRKVGLGLVINLDAALRDRLVEDRRHTPLF